jgi:hypothetical protein
VRQAAKHLGDGPIDVHLERPPDPASGVEDPEHPQQPAEVGERSAAMPVEAVGPGAHQQPAGGERSSGRPLPRGVVLDLRLPPVEGRLELPKPSLEEEVHNPAEIGVRR